MWANANYADSLQNDTTISKAKKQYIAVATIALGANSFFFAEILESWNQKLISAPIYKKCWVRSQSFREKSSETVKFAFFRKRTAISRIFERRNSYRLTGTSSEQSMHSNRNAKIKLNEHILGTVCICLILQLTYNKNTTPHFSL